MSGEPVESTPAGKTRRRAADRRVRAESSSSIKSDRPDATVVRREESDSASYVRLHHRDSDLPRHVNSFPVPDAILLVPQLLNIPSNPPPPHSVSSPLLHQMKQLSSVLATQSTAMTAVSDHLDRLEHSRSDRSDCEFADLQSSVPWPPSSPQSSSTVASRDEIAPTRPPKMPPMTR